ncbi:Mitogen-activated protein kinase kinase kinase A [Diplonema papillatum]|nr:Mitogen-activated protein kinase kinase kinase A [Diplonema papillatum]
MQRGLTGIPEVVQVKYAFRKEIRMLTVKRCELPFRKLVEYLRMNAAETLAGAAPPAAGARLVLRYFDDDNELVSVVDEGDWFESLARHADDPAAEAAEAATQGGSAGGGRGKSCSATLTGIPEVVKVKYAFRKEIRMLTVKRELPFRKLVELPRMNTAEMLAGAAPPAAGARLVLRYFDDDNELVSMVDEGDSLRATLRTLLPKRQKLRRRVRRWWEGKAMQRDLTGIPEVVKVKYAFRKEIRMLTVKRELPFRKLVELLRMNTAEMLAGAAPPAAGARLVLRYFDDDNELVSMVDEGDWFECLAHYAEDLLPKRQKLRLFVSFAAAGDGGLAVDELPLSWVSAETRGSSRGATVSDDGRRRELASPGMSTRQDRVGSGGSGGGALLCQRSPSTPLGDAFLGGSLSRRSVSWTLVSPRGEPETDESDVFRSPAIASLPPRREKKPASAGKKPRPDADKQPALPQSAGAAASNPTPPVNQPGGQPAEETPELTDSAKWSRELKGWVRGNVIGRGAHSEVYICMSRHSAKLFAVKQTVLNKRDADHASKLNALQKEIELMSSYRHENIVRYLGSEIKSGAFNIFLEYVPGGSIASVLQRFGAFHERVVRHYTRQILNGLHFLHQNCVIHRDIKGANILVSDKGQVKLADFGCSKQIAAESTGTQTLLGTALWMAPEVIHSSKYGEASDIWSVGCTVLEMVTGRPPWTTELTFECEIQAMYHIAHCEAPPRLPSHLSRNAKDFLRTTFMFDPAARSRAGALSVHPFIVEECVDISDIGKTPETGAAPGKDLDHTIATMTDCTAFTLTTAVGQESVRPPASEGNASPQRQRGRTDTFEAAFGGPSAAASPRASFSWNNVTRVPEAPAAGAGDTTQQQEPASAASTPTHRAPGKPQKRGFEEPPKAVVRDESIILDYLQASARRTLLTNSQQFEPGSLAPRPRPDPPSDDESTHSASLDQLFTEQEDLLAAVAVVATHPNHQNQHQNQQQREQLEEEGEAPLVRRTASSPEGRPRKKLSSCKRPRKSSPVRRTGSAAAAGLPRQASAPRAIKPTVGSKVRSSVPLIPHQASSPEDEKVVPTKVPPPARRRREPNLEFSELVVDSTYLPKGTR